MNDINRIHVYVRARPKSADESSESDAIEIHDDFSQMQVVEHKSLREKTYCFDQIFPETAKNNDIYNVAGRPLVEAAINGFNGTLFAYGQTGAGKTYTLMSEEGLTVKLVNNLFRAISKDRKCSYKVSCSYIQIYQERIYDLLNPTSQHYLVLREDPLLGIHIENLSEYVCHTPSDVFELLVIGREGLVTAETTMNRQSSRYGVHANHYLDEGSSACHSDKSHSVCQINVEKRIKGSSVPSEISSSTPVTPRDAKHYATREGDMLNNSTGSFTSPFAHCESEKEDNVFSNSCESVNLLSPRKADRPTLKRRNSSKTLIPVRKNNQKSRPSSSSSQYGTDVGGSPRTPRRKQNENQQAFDDDLLNNKDVDELKLLSSANKDILLKGRINICDLAGSERVKKTNAEGDRLQEAKKINLSLLELGNVIAALADGKRAHVPYRNSILTRLLQDSLGGNCKTSFVLCISPVMKDIGETKSTLEFGQRALRVSTAPKVNIQVDYKRLADELQQKLDQTEKDHANIQERLVAANMTLQESLQKETEKRLKQVNDMTLELSKAQHDVKSIETNLQNSNKEKMRSFLLAQLMSLQLVYNMADLRRLANNTNDVTNEKDIESEVNVVISRASSTPPSGYESASTRSDEIQSRDTYFYSPTNQNPPSLRELRHSSSLVSSLNRDSKEMSAIEELLVTGPIETSPTSLDTSTDSENQSLQLTERLSSLRREVKHLRCNIEHDAVKSISAGFFDGTEDHIKGENADKKLIYSRLTNHLLNATKKTKYSEELLEQTFNAVLLDHTLSSCLVVLGDDEKIQKIDNEDGRMPSSTEETRSEGHLPQVDFIQTFFRKDSSSNKATPSDASTQTLLNDYENYHCVSYVDLESYPDEDNTSMVKKKKRSKNKLLSRLMCFPVRKRHPVNDDKRPKKY